MNLIFVCSPLVGNIPELTTEHHLRAVMENNQAMAEMYCWWVSEQGQNPYAPHLLCTRFLDDTIPEERERGISLGLHMLERCDEIWVFLRRGEEPSRGMKREIAKALRLNIPVRYIDSEIVEMAFAAARKMDA